MVRNKRIIGLVLGLSLAIMLPAVAGCSGSEKEAAVVESGAEAKQLLKEGNERFVKGELAVKDVGGKRREELAKEQKPFAVVVCCSDSRVPPELIFDQGLGDLFTVRVAGNVVDDLAVGSVEYGVEHLKAPLIVVLGHEGCGAVKATVEGAKVSGSIGSIINKIQPSVEKAKEEGASGEKIIGSTVEANVKRTVSALEGSGVLREKIDKGELMILGAVYNLKTGSVDWI